MTVLAPTADVYGAALDAQIATVQALVNKTAASSILYPQYVQQLNMLQMEAVDHYMVTGWLAAYVILATYQPNSRDKTGQTLLARVAFLQNLYNNAPAPLPGNSEGYGGSGWVTVAQNYAIALYAAQITLVEYLMATTVYGTSAATMLANLTGSQSFPFAYVFNSVGFTDSWIDD
jgi:hypothetical protein